MTDGILLKNSPSPSKQPFSREKNLIPSIFIIIMLKAVGQFITTTQFYLYGRQHFTRTGWENSVRIL